MSRTHIICTLILAAGASLVSGHGRVTAPQARNGNDNGAVGGGPGTVYQGGKYQHGICGNAPGTTQTYNAVGEVQGRYKAGDVAEITIVITAHHVGFFEFELCDDAGQLSEECFMKHRLLKEGCECSCGSDTTLSCPECNRCRQWWKPLLEGELSQVVTEGYPGPILKGQGNLVQYEYIMRFVIPSDVKTSNGVLRWHYMTTNSCTSSSSAPEEFWNCADVAISNDDNDFGPNVPYDNEALQALPVSDIRPLIDSQQLKGVYVDCPTDVAGERVTVGNAEDYEGACGAEINGTYENCKSAQGNETVAGCKDLPASGILCESECSQYWWQCANDIAYMMTVPAGTRCKSNSFVLEAECLDVPTTQAPTQSPAPTSTQAPIPTPGPTTTPDPTQSPAPSSTQAPVPTPGPTIPPDPTQSPVASSTQAPTQVPTQAPEAICNGCSACLWSNGQCYTDADEDYCLQWPDNTWCGTTQSSSLLGEVAPSGTLAKIHPHIETDSVHFMQTPSQGTAGHSLEL